MEVDWNLYFDFKVLLKIALQSKVRATQGKAGQ